MLTVFNLRYHSVYCYVDLLKEHTGNLHCYAGFIYSGFNIETDSNSVKFYRNVLLDVVYCLRCI
jgi:hypothetical protein